MRIKIPSLKTTGYVLFFGYCLFADLFDAKLGQGFRLGLWGVVLVLLIMGMKSKFVINRNNIIVVILVSAMFLINNKGLENGNYMTTVKFFLFMAIAFIVKNSYESYGSIIKTISRLGLIHVFATYLFFVIPSLYNIMYSIWGYYPGGTGRGKYAYRAGLSDHYSGNGIVIAITYLALFAYILSHTGLDSKKKRRLSISLFLLAFFAVILTTKRAHLLFGVLSMIFVYYFSNPQKLKSRSFKLVIIGAALLILLFVFADNIPIIKETLDRFEDMEEDSHMASRYRLWEHALQMFARSPFIGQGWMSFRYEYAQFFYTGRTNANVYMNAHNIYIQLLAEVGLVGIVLFFAIVAYLVYTAFRLIYRFNQIQTEDRRDLTPLYFAILFLLFFLLYGFTGNCLYDNVQPYFFVAGGIILGFKDHYKVMLNQRGKIYVDGCPMPERV